MLSRNHRVRGVAFAAALLVVLAAPAAMAQTRTSTGDNLRIGDGPSANSQALDTRAVDQSGTQYGLAASSLPPGPSSTITEGKMAGAEVGASDHYGFDDSKLNARVKRAFGQ